MILDRTYWQNKFQQLSGSELEKTKTLFREYCSGTSNSNNSDDNDVIENLLAKRINWVIKTSQADTVRQLLSEIVLMLPDYFDWQNKNSNLIHLLSATGYGMILDRTQWQMKFDKLKGCSELEKTKTLLIEYCSGTSNSNNQNDNNTIDNPHADIIATVIDSSQAVTVRQLLSEIVQALPIDFNWQILHSNLIHLLSAVAYKTRAIGIHNFNLLRQPQQTITMQAADENLALPILDETPLQHILGQCLFHNGLDKYLTYALVCKDWRNAVMHINTLTYLFTELGIKPTSIKDSLLAEQVVTPTVKIVNVDANDTFSLQDYMRRIKLTMHQLRWLPHSIANSLADNFNEFLQIPILDLNGKFYKHINFVTPEMMTHSIMWGSDSCSRVFVSICIYSSRYNEIVVRNFYQRYVNGTTWNMSVDTSGRNYLPQYANHNDAHHSRNRYEFLNGYFKRLRRNEPCGDTDCTTIESEERINKKGESKIRLSEPVVSHDTTSNNLSITR